MNQISIYFQPNHTFPEKYFFDPIIQKKKKQLIHFSFFTTFFYETIGGVPSAFPTIASI